MGFDFKIKPEDYFKKYLATNCKTPIPTTHKIVWIFAEFIRSIKSILRSLIWLVASLTSSLIESCKAATTSSAVMV